MSAHTPGEWLQDDRHTGDKFAYVIGYAGSDIARITLHGDGEGLANAHLIAAAPELLAAANRALRVFKAQGETAIKGNVVAALESAIAKATGGAA